MALAFSRISRYWQRLHLVRGSSRLTTVEVLETYVEKAQDDGFQDIVLVMFHTAPTLLDYLRTTFAPERGVSFDERFEAIKTV